jgi:hypothetical protein
MKLLSLPLVACFSSFSTWLWLEKPKGQSATTSFDNEIEVQPEDDFEEKADNRTLDFGLACSRDNVDTWNPLTGAFTLLCDAFTYAVDLVVAQIWPWPQDSASTFPRLGLGSLAGAVFERVQDMIVVVIATLVELTRGDAVDGSSSVQSCIAWLTGSAAVLRVNVATVLEGFLAKYPRYRSALGESDPLWALCLFMMLGGFTAWEIYGCWRGLRWIVRTIAHASSFPCRLCSKKTSIARSGVGSGDKCGPHAAEVESSASPKRPKRAQASAGGG